MALKTIRIGSATDIYQYDDAAFATAVHTEGPIQVDTAPVNPNEVLRLSDVPVAGNTVTATVNITDHAIVRGEGGAKGIQDSLNITDDAGNTTIAGWLKIQTIKSGATQVAAGAAADELWKTNGHGSLPDNVVMIGV